MIPAGTRPWTRQQIGSAFGVDSTNVADWVLRPGFPRLVGTARLAATAGKSEVYDAQLVIDWVAANRPLLSAGGAGAETETAGLDRLVGRKRLGAEMGQLTSGRELADGTVRGHLSRGKIPPADRTPGDGLEPEVGELSWYLSTLVRAAAQFGTRGRPRKEPDAAPARRQPVDVPPALDEDLLDLAEFTAAIGAGTGRELRPNTVKAYSTRDQMPAPDRKPDDGLAPEVPTKLWRRSTVAAEVIRRRSSAQVAAHAPAPSAN